MFYLCSCHSPRDLHVQLCFALEEKQGVIVKGECSSWYKRVGDFYCEFGTGEKKLCMTMDQYVQPDRTTPLQSVRSIALSTIVVECE